MDQEGFGLSYYWTPMVHVLDLHGDKGLPPLKF